MLQIFTNYSWPGNVRELQHVIEGLVALCPNAAITVDQLPDQLRSSLPKVLLDSSSHTDGLSLKQVVEMVEMHMIDAALKNSPSAAAAAQRLGIDASTLSKKRKRYGL